LPIPVRQVAAAHAKAQSANQAAMAAMAATPAHLVVAAVKAAPVETITVSAATQQQVPAG